MFGGAVMVEERDVASAVVAIGMSAGALEVLRTIVQSLPDDLPGALVIAYHVAAPSILPELLGQWTRKPSMFAAAGMALARGTIYVCPPQQHVIVNPDRTLEVAPRERVNFVRPSIDWLFESVGGSFDERSIAVVLSGANSDGAEGVRGVRRAGGRVLVQDPSSAHFPAMPAASARWANAILPPAQLGPASSKSWSGSIASPRS